jgi:hypothetical protein
MPHNANEMRSLPCLLQVSATRSHIEEPEGGTNKLKALFIKLSIPSTDEKISAY